MYTKLVSKSQRGGKQKQKQTKKEPKKIYQQKSFKGNWKLSELVFKSEGSEQALQNKLFHTGKTLDHIYLKEGLQWTEVWKILFYNKLERKVC